ncbi:MAG: alpha-(1-_6)-mannopyranosyltransferase A [Corynebacterium sp.]|nr:alpha-(1->6)-mannopyranosyltransferase A [Corynebacterium sp.]MDY5786101.1 alpha-(1->6)-mannopyranosyltransferase A [Corynebacterium sp.]
MLNRMTPSTWGLAAAILVAIGSYGAGATRNRGGIMRELGLAHLTYGHGRSIFEIILTVGIAGLVAAWVILGRDLKRDRADATTMARATWAWTLPLAVAAPILSRDVYSYLMQGAMLRDGFDPYSEGAAVNPGPYLLEVSHDWRNTTTPYGPLHLGIGKLITTVVGENVTLGIVAYKLLSLAGFALIAYCVPRLAARIGGNPAMAVWLGVLNPVMLLHMVGGMHNESVMVGLVSLGLLLCTSSRWITPGVALIALAVALKATAAVALPFVVWMLYHRHAAARSSWAGRLGVFVASGAWVVAISALVVNLATVLSGSTWGWIAEISGNSKVVNPLSGPTLVADVITPAIQLVNGAFSYNTALSIARAAAGMLMLAGLVVTWVIFHPRGEQTNRRAVMGTTLAYAIAFTTNAVTLPWYYASVVTLVGTFNPPRWLKKLTIVASVFVALGFTGSGNHRLYDAWFLLIAVTAACAAAAWVYPSRTNGAQVQSADPAGAALPR